MALTAALPRLKPEGKDTQNSLRHPDGAWRGCSEEELRSSLPAREQPEPLPKAAQKSLCHC